MEYQKVALVIADISGYTQFIRSKRLSAIHSEEIIFELLETMIDGAAFPLILNKLEGDATLLYAKVTDDPATVAQDITQQVLKLFDIFYERLKSLSQERSGCSCDACQNVLNLRLKAFLHVGTAIFRKIRQFEEMAGADVILIHQLLKNSIPSNEYIAMTDPFHRLVNTINDMPSEKRQELCQSFGDVTIHVFYPQIDHSIRPS